MFAAGPRTGPAAFPSRPEEEKTMRKIAFTLVLTSLVSLAACNTANGVGKDLKSAGSAVSDASGQNKKK
jgi:predicted small secreted protein